MNTEVTIAHGRVRGHLHEGVVRFLGIPYAAAPVGELRFQAPQPPEPWAGVREADRFGPTPPKPPYPAPLDTLLPELDIEGDAWLTVNVWTPDIEAEGLPVMVWIHGGAFTNGNSANPVYDGTTFARDGVVLVTLNYRLGVEGFAVLPDAPPNRGLLDQVAALEWVRDNIRAFGGDPANVTLFGESAGGMSVTLLLSSPRAQGLFARAITQSGSVQAAATPEDAAKVTAELGRILGVTPTRESLSRFEPLNLVAAQRMISMMLTTAPDVNRFGESIVMAGMAFIPMVDGDLIPVHPLAALASGAGSSVPLLTGYNKDEYRLFLMPSGLGAALSEPMVAGMLAGMRIPQQVTDLYRANRPDATPGDLLAALLTDAFFRLPALQVVAARLAIGAQSFVYEFAESSPVYDLRACHALEVGYVFDNVVAGDTVLYGPSPSPAVACAMHAAWLAFARTGNPGWPAYDETHPVMVFGSPQSHLVHDPTADERTAWTLP